MEKTPTVMEAVRLSEGYLQKHGVESPRLSAEHLLAKALRCSRLDLYLRFGERLEEKTLFLLLENLFILLDSKLQPGSATSTSWFTSVGVPTIGIRHDNYQRICMANVAYDDDN